MNWQEAALVAVHPSLERFRHQARESNGDVGQRDAARATLLRLAGGEPGYPPLLTQAGNLARSVAAAARDGFAVVSKDEQARRLSVCHACPEYDAGPGRCRRCGCAARLKARVRSSACPLAKW